MPNKGNPSRFYIAVADEAQVKCLKPSLNLAISVLKPHLTRSRTYRDSEWVNKNVLLKQTTDSAKITEILTGQVVDAMRLHLSLLMMPVQLYSD
jgi:hypothetical protein